MKAIKTSKKRIGIDARFYGPLGKGLGRYIQEIVDNIVNIDSKNEYVIFLKKDNYDEFVCRDPRIKKVIADVTWYTFAEQVLMPFFIWREKLDLVHFPHFNVPFLTPTKFVVTIHDLILTKFATTRATTLSSFTYFLKNIAYKMIIWVAIFRAKKIIAVSEFTKKDIVEQFKVNPDKIIVTVEGVANLARGKDSLFVSKLDDRETLLSYNINSSFILYVGNAYPHKNLEGLIEVFEKLLEKRPDFRLVLVGKEDYFYKKVKAFAASKGLLKEESAESPIVFPGYVPDNKLEVLYKKARTYVFPSFYEGFGLPPLEAMAKGCPVVSSNQSSMPEILGEAALYFDPRNKDDMLEKILEIISNEDLRARLKEDGFKQVKKYNWWECARETLEIYKKVVSDI